MNKYRNYTTSIYKIWTKSWKKNSYIELVDGKIIYTYFPYKTL